VEEVPRKAIAVPMIILINIFVFLWWGFSHNNPQFMLDNFTISWTGLAEGRYWTLLTSAFSHNLLWHIFLNMFVLSSFGTIMENILGFQSFLKFYLSAAVVSSLSHAIVSAWILNEPDIPALGASGAISAVILVFAFIYPKERIWILGIIPIPALWGALAFIGLDAWGLVAQAEGGGLPIGHGAHIGGALTGIAYYYLSIRPRLRFKISH
jgi:rhomboid-like protein